MVGCWDTEKEQETTSLLLSEGRDRERGGEEGETAERYGSVQLLGRGMKGEG